MHVYVKMASKILIYGFAPPYEKTLVLEEVQINVVIRKVGAQKARHVENC